MTLQRSLVKYLILNRGTHREIFFSISCTTHYRLVLQNCQRVIISHQYLGNYVTYKYASARLYGIKIHGEMVEKSQVTHLSFYIHYIYVTAFLFILSLNMDLLYLLFIQVDRE